MQRSNRALSSSSIVLHKVKSNFSDNAMENIAWEIAF